MNKIELKTAIEESDLYSSSEKLLLLELIELAIDFVAVASAKYLKQKTGLSTTTTYTSLSSLKRRGVITLNTSEPNSYSLNKEELSRLLMIYHNRKS